MRSAHDFLPWMIMDATLAEFGIHGLADGKKQRILNWLSMDDSNWHPCGIHKSKDMRFARGSEAQNQ
jgi:hypothetical protein